MKRRTAGAIVVTFACLTMLAISALSVKGCTACFGGGWCRGDETPADTQVTPMTPPGARGAADARGARP